MAQNTRKDELNIIASGRRKNSQAPIRKSRQKGRLTFNVITMNIFTVLMYLVTLGFVALAAAMLPRIMRSSEALSRSDVFYDGYYIALNLLVVLIYFLWGYGMGRFVRHKNSLKQVMLSFSVITIANLALMLFLTILGLTASGNVSGFEWMVFVTMNYAFMPLMDLFSKITFIPGITYIGYFAVAIIPAVVMAIGAKWRK